MSSGTQNSTPSGTDPLVKGPAGPQDAGGDGAGTSAQAGGPYSQGAKSGGQAGPVASGTLGLKNIPAGIPGVVFEMNGETVEARPGETIWAVAQRLGTHTPPLCHKPDPGYRPDGNCRACMERSRVSACSRPRA